MSRGNTTDSLRERNRAVDSALHGGLASSPASPSQGRAHSSDESTVPGTSSKSAVGRPASAGGLLGLPALGYASGSASNGSGTPSGSTSEDRSESGANSYGALAFCQSRVWSAAAAVARAIPGGAFGRVVCVAITFDLVGFIFGVFGLQLAGSGVYQVVHSSVVVFSALFNLWFCGIRIN